MKTRKRIPIGILVRGGGGFDSLSRQLELGKIAINMVVRGVAGLIPYQDSLKVRSQSI